MKECSLKKFKRNNYFYGKLLSAGDFVTEQEYFNGKRKLINRLVLGNGIVKGLDVKRSADNADSVNITAGVAIDPFGREIVVPEEIKNMDLMPLVSEVKDVTYEKGKTYIFYLSLTYNENGRDQAFSLAKADMQSEPALEHNHIHEGFRFSLVQNSIAEKRPVVEAGQECAKDCNICRNIYLAKLTIACADKEKFTLNSVGNVPKALDDRVYNNKMIYDLVKELEESDKKENEAIKELKDEISKINSGIVCGTSTGIVTFEEIEPDKDYFSDEINPGFDKGCIHVELGIVIEDSKEEWCGDAEFFTGSEEFKGKYPNIVTGALVNQEKGTFVVGVRLKAKPAIKNVNIRWWVQQINQ